MGRQEQSDPTALWNAGLFRWQDVVTCAARLSWGERKKKNATGVAQVLRPLLTCIQVEGLG